MITNPPIFHPSKTGGNLLIPKSPPDLKSTSRQCLSKSWGLIGIVWTPHSTLLIFGSQKFWSQKNTNRFFGDLYKSGWWVFFTNPTWKICMPKWKSSPNRHLKHTVWNHHPASVLHCKSPLFLLCPEVDSCPWVVFYLKLPPNKFWWILIYPPCSWKSNPGRKNVAKLLTSSSPVVGPSWAYCRSPRWPVRGAGLQNLTKKTWN